MANWFRRSGKLLAIVATGTPGQSPPEPTHLELLALRLGAPLKRRQRLLGLAEVFVAYLRDHRGRAVRRGRFAVTADAPPSGASAAGLPELTAYILSAPQKGAEVLLRAETDPVLARRRVGLGRSVTLAVVFSDEDNRAWATSSRVGRMLAEALKWCLRHGGDPRFAGHLLREGGSCRFWLDARDRNGPINLLRLSLELDAVRGKGRDRRALALPQVAPGRYEVVFERPQGPLTLLARRASGQPVWQRAFGASFGREFAQIGADWATLRRLAALTGGRIVSSRELTNLTGRW